MALGLLLAGAAQADQGEARLRLAVFPPTDLTGVDALRGIILGGARPVASTHLPFVWLVALEPGRNGVPGAIVTDAGPLVALAKAACLSKEGGK